jgi:hypothetical protein
VESISCHVTAILCNGDVCVGEVKCLIRARVKKELCQECGRSFCEYVTPEEGTFTSRILFAFYYVSSIRLTELVGVKLIFVSAEQPSLSCTGFAEIAFITVSLDDTRFLFCRRTFTRVVKSLKEFKHIRTQSRE